MRTMIIETPSCEGSSVELSGWVKTIRDHGGKLFFELEDSSGSIQVIATGFSVPSTGSTVTITGMVTQRPKQAIKKGDVLGAWEVLAEKLEVHSQAAPTPLGSDATEPVRLKYRYLDLRSSQCEIIKTRAKALSAARQILEEEGFFETETPILAKPTPEGAKEFLTGEKLQYSLAQSPQLYKQLLMVAGLEKYYQIARCFRDEGGRADRQPEFTQIDVEASFMSEQEIREIAEKVVRAIWEKTSTKSIPKQIPVITWQEAMEKYGSDKPDLRISEEIQTLKKPLPFPQGEHSAFLAVPGTKSSVKKTLAEVTSPLPLRIMTGEIFQTESVVVVATGSWLEVQETLGRARLALCPRITEESKLCWVVSAPLFLPSEEGLTSTHHPFTKPAGEVSEKALSYSYDIVCDGVELGGGSLRIHSLEQQLEVLRMLGHSDEKSWEELGFFLEALRHGAPPHGGFALGLDRLLAVARGETSIREVMTFPKASTGSDPLTL